MARIVGSTGTAPVARKPQRRRQPQPQPNPDQRIPRSPAQRARDQRAVTRNISTARRQIAQRQAQAIRQQYVSQGQAVARQAQRLDRQTRLTQPHHGGVDQIAKFIYRHFVPHTNAQTQRFLRTHPHARPGDTMPGERAQTSSPAALFIMQQLARTNHAIAAAAKSDVRTVQQRGLGHYLTHGGGAAARHAAARGFQNRDTSTFTDVLAQAGWKPRSTAGRIARGAAGFALDVGTDPLTYATAPIGAAGRGVSAAARRVPGSAKIAEGARGSLPVRLARHVNPNIRPAGVSAEDFAAVREAMRRSRAVASTGEHHARNVAQAIARKLPGNHHPQITDALEEAGKPVAPLKQQLKMVADKTTGQGHTQSLAESARQATAKPLAKNEREVVGVLQREYGRIHAAEHAKGLVGPKFPEFGYSPRRPISELERAGSQRRLSGAQLASSKARTNRLPYKEFRGTEKDIYTENAPLAYYLRARDSAVKMGRNEIIQSLHQVGRVFHPGLEIKPGEDIYKFAPRKMPARVEGDELKSLMHGGAPAGRNEYRVINNELVRTAAQSAPQRLEGLEELGRLWDRSIQGRIKTILTVPNPQYHLTNLYGDLYNAYLGSSVPKLARNLGISVRALRYKARREAASKTLGKQIAASGTVKIAGQQVGIDQLLKEAENHGAIGQGFIGRDLADVLDAQGKEAAEKVGQGRIASKFGRTGQRVAISKAGSRIVHPIDTIRDIGQYREDSVRLATYLGARKRGLTPDKAAAFVARHHFDYADLTQFERSVLRRVLPFYTFTARNTPLQIRSLTTNPAKLASLEKVREESRKASDVPGGYEKNLRLFEQQGLPIPVPGTGQLLYPKLPATDLSRLTVKDQGNYLLQMLTPIIKAPVELSQNYSFFFRQPIDKLLASPGVHGEAARTLKPAPAWLIHGIQRLPGNAGEAILRDLHIRQYVNQGTGKRIWGWPAKLDYLLKQTPATGTALQIGTGATTSRGQTTGQKIFGYATGLRVAPYSTPQINQDRAYQEYSYLQAKAQEMRHNGDAYAKDGSRTAAYQRVLNQTRAVVKQLPPRRGTRTRGAGAGFSPAAAAALQALPSTGGRYSPAAQAALDAFGGR